jgi:methylmalonyl-CoA mutase cobalamin-binding domain/chain
MIDKAVLKQTLGDLDEGGVAAILDGFIASNPSVEETQQVVEACQQGMEIVGDNFENGTYFVGDLMYAAQILTESLEKLKPFMSAGAGQATVGTLVLGTVAGDIHDIGKNIFKALLEASGFNVVDIGIDQTPEAFVEAAKASNADIIGLSGVLTLSISSMKDTVEALRTAGLRDSVKVMIGGNAVSEETCTFVGADYWSKNAATSVKKGMEYMS